MARILLIDDSQSTLTLLSQWLAKAGHEVTATSASAAGLALLSNGNVDLVVTDIYMPEPDGLEILRRARAAGLTLPFIAMSSKGDAMNFFLLARKLGAAATLQKPFFAPELLAAVDAALNPSASERC
jgi:DNA-binding response OmpR family regulator